MRHAVLKIIFNIHVRWKLGWKFRIATFDHFQGFTISGARNKLQEIVQGERDRRRAGEVMLEGVEVIEVDDSSFGDGDETAADEGELVSQKLQFVRRELSEIRELLSATH